jgi:hypothetical protein
MSIFKKKRPIDNFNANYMHMKTMLWKTFRVLFNGSADIRLASARSGIPTSGAFDKFAAQAVDFLLGERKYITFNGEASEELSGLAEKIYSLQNTRPMIDALRDWKYEKLNELLGTEWTESEEAKRLAEIISQEDGDIKHTGGYVKFMGDLRKLRF